MFAFVTAFALCNLIGGRSKDVFAPDFGMGRFIFRALLPSIITGCYAYEQDLGLTMSLIVLAITLAASTLWFAPNWSFDEINGQYDPNKYPLWVKKIGLHFFPLDSDPATVASTNRKRGMVMKGLRGMYEYPGCIALGLFTPWAYLIGLLTALQGVMFWACGRIFPKYPVAMAEAVWGAMRGLRYGLSIALISSAPLSL
jgi:hypothetical protein